MLPPLLSSRSATERMVAAVVIPVIFGAFTGVVLGWSSTWFTVLLLVALLGGFVAGTEHDTLREGVLRGVLGGVLFNGALLLAHVVAGTDAEASLPDPAVLLLPINSLVSTVAGLAGAATRRRLASRAAVTP